MRHERLKLESKFDGVYHARDESCFSTTEMAPGKRVHPIKIRVPRHNAQKIGSKLSGEVESQARAQDLRADTYQPNSESAAALNQAIVRLNLQRLIESSFRTGERFGMELNAHNG
jgi:hypothetical protein